MNAHPSAPDVSFLSLPCCIEDASQSGQRVSMQTPINAAETTEDLLVCDITSENVEPLQALLKNVGVQICTIFCVPSGISAQDHPHAGLKE